LLPKTPKPHKKELIIYQYLIRSKGCIISAVFWLGLSVTRTFGFLFSPASTRFLPADLGFEVHCLKAL